MSVRTPTIECPHCGDSHDRATDAEAPDSRGLPSPGDVAICVNCGEISLYTEGLLKRKPTDVELFKLAMNEDVWRTITITQRAIQRRGPIR